jgi:LysR family transcriptional regulator, glycine cleavage system transcriptional activator
MFRCPQHHLPLRSPLALLAGPLVRTGAAEYACSVRAPPLGLLQTLEVAARHESFSRAAAELHLTPAAVSQQIRNLERLLGIALFVRSARSLTLTESGRDYADRIRFALDDVQRATCAVRQPVDGGVLQVSTFHAFGLLWLLPRLPQFRAAHPAIELRLSFSRDLVHPSRDGADVAIRFGSGRYARSEAIELARDVIVPVCSPQLLAGRPVPRGADELRAFPWLHDAAALETERTLCWKHWLPRATRGAADLLLPDGLTTIEAALLGYGIALARRSLIDTHLRAGRLIRVTSLEKQMDFSYWIVTAPGDRRPRVIAFMDWLRAAMSADC